MVNNPCIYMVSFILVSSSRNNKQFLYVLLLQANTCLHFLHSHGFFSAYSSCRTQIWKFFNILFPIPRIRMVSLWCEFLLILWMNLLKFLLINLILEMIWSFSKSMHLRSSKQWLDPPHSLHSYGFSSLWILQNQICISSKNVSHQLLFLTILLCWLN